MNRHTATVRDDVVSKAFEFSWVTNSFFDVEECVPGEVLAIHRFVSGISSRCALLLLLLAASSIVVIFFETFVF